MELEVNSENVSYTERYIESKYLYQHTKAEKIGNKIFAKPMTEKLVFRTVRKVPKLGVMLIGWGGNNGTTFTAAVLSNKLGLSWPTKKGQKTANCCMEACCLKTTTSEPLAEEAEVYNFIFYFEVGTYLQKIFPVFKIRFGSVTQASTIRISEGIHVPLAQILPSVHPDELMIDGWDISSINLAEAMERAQVLEPLLQQQLKPIMANMKPRPAIFDQGYIADNQNARADNVLRGTKQQQVVQIMEDIEEFKNSSEAEKIIVVWTANTERFSDILEGVNDTLENLEAAIRSNHKEISPSTLFAYASISKGCTFINGAPQNTFVPGLVELAEQKKVFIAGDDFKSGQTKIKSVLVDFLVSAGIKPVSIVSYNHLGNNDGKNLSAPNQFRSKEISKSNVIDDMVASNNILYEPGEKPDHVVVIKYVPFVGDSKRAMDEYTSEIMLGGLNTIVVHNTCEDSLLAAPIILDLVILAELFSRIQVKREGWSDAEYTALHPVLSVLSYLCKAPLVPNGTPVVNALFRQRACIENILKACVGLPPDSNMNLEHKVLFLMEALENGEPKSKKMRVRNGD